MIILLITKSEAKILHEQYGIGFKCEGGISSSSPNCYKKNKKYYLCERDYNMRAIEKIRKIRTIG